MLQCQKPRGKASPGKGSPKAKARGKGKQNQGHGDSAPFKMKFKYPIEFQIFVPPGEGHKVTKEALRNALRKTEGVIVDAVLNAWTNGVLKDFPKRSKGLLGL